MKWKSFKKAEQMFFFLGFNVYELECFSMGINYLEIGFLMGFKEAFYHASILGSKLRGI